MRLFSVYSSIQSSQFCGNGSCHSPSLQMERNQIPESLENFRKPLSIIFIICKSLINRPSEFRWERSSHFDEIGSKYFQTMFSWDMCSQCKKGYSAHTNVVIRIIHFAWFEHLFGLKYGDKEA